MMGKEFDEALVEALLAIAAVIEKSNQRLDAMTASLLEDNDE